MLELDSHSLIHVAQTSLRVVKQPVKQFISTAKDEAQRAKSKATLCPSRFALCPLPSALCSSLFALSKRAGRTGEFFDFSICLEARRGICVEDRLNIVGGLVCM